MSRRRSISAQEIPPPSPDTSAERWTIIQTASHLSLPYQVARNNMLSGDYGPTEYDAKSRKLTVLADRVRAVKSKRGRKPKKRRENG